MDNHFINFINKLKQQKKTNFQLSLQKKRIGNRFKVINFAYDLQTGSYIRDWEKKRQRYNDFINEIVNVIRINFGDVKFLLDAGCGELTNTVQLKRKMKKTHVYAFDFSLNRLLAGKKFFKLNNYDIKLICASLIDIPFQDNSFDICVTMHAIEPNKDFEKKIIDELSRVSTKGMILVEPDFKIADLNQKKRMKKFGYVQNLENVLKQKKFLFKKIPMKHFLSVKNKSSIFVVFNKKKNKSYPVLADPFLKKKISKIKNDFAYSKRSNTLYPVIRNIPVFKKDCAILLPIDKVKKNVLLR
tara:strand:- start:1363 stop:2262 length:900 start_codon:yes stop_codon:yes gene_type:complete